MVSLGVVQQVFHPAQFGQHAVKIMGEILAGYFDIRFVQ